MSESERRPFSTSIEQLLEQYEEGELPDALQSIKDNAMDILSSIDLWEKAELGNLDPIYSDVDEYRDAQLSRMGREIRAITNAYVNGLGYSLDN